MVKAKDLREQSLEELESAYYDLSKSLYELRCEWASTRKLENPHLVKEYRRDIAKYLTVIREKGNSNDS